MSGAVQINIALVGAVHPNMPGDDEGLFRKTAAELSKFTEELECQLEVFQDLLHTEEDGRRAKLFCEEKKADLVILFNASLPFGRVILPLAKVKARLALWSVPEPVTEGILQLNSFCGTNMLGSIVANYLHHYEIPYKWLYGLPDSPRFRERLGVTIRALRAVKAVESASIAQIGGLAMGFENMYIDERLLEYKIGSRLQTRHTVEEIIDRGEAYSEREAKEGLDKLTGPDTKTADALSPEQLLKAGRLYRAFTDFIDDFGYTALGISCWSRFQEKYGIAVCGVMSRLNEDGFVSACEGDIPAVVNMIMFNAMSGGKSSLNDLVAFDDSDDTINLWHCGVAPQCWAGQKGLTWDRHFNIGCYQGEEWNGDGVVANMQFRPGTITVATMNNSFDNLFILTGDILPEKKGYHGSTGWVGNLSLNGSPVSLEDLMNTIITERVNHHYPAVYGSFRDELNEFAAWKGIGVLDVRKYESFIQLPTKA